MARVGLAAIAAALWLPVAACGSDPGTATPATSLELTENEPAKTGPATTYACDLSDAGELFLTAGVSIGPHSGTAEANLRAALSNNEGEPVDGLGEVGGYHEGSDNVATAAGVKQAGDQWMVVFVHGAPGNKEQLVAVAQDLAQKV